MNFLSSTVYFQVRKLAQLNLGFGHHLCEDRKGILVPCVQSTDTQEKLYAST
jgi:hypothetical protein